MAGFLRITGGELVRRHIKVPKAADEGLTRPTGDMARAAVFSALAARVENAQVLDLFGGSGAYGFEALSRGAASVVFVEKARATAACIEENAQILGVLEHCQVLVQDAIHFVKKASPEHYDLLFVDPPYSLSLDSSFWEALLSFLQEDSVVIFRCKEKKDFACPHGYRITRERAYGGTMIFFLALGAGDA